VGGHRTHTTDRHTAVSLCCDGARGKRRGFSPGAAARQSQSARVHVRQNQFSPLLVELSQRSRGLLESVQPANPNFLPDFLFTPPHPSVHPAPDFTPHKILPRPRIHPAPDFTPPQISPHPRFNGHAGSTLCQIAGAPRVTFHADSDAHQIHPPVRSNPRAESQWGGDESGVRVNL